jgi:hypothetical protein
VEVNVASEAGELSVRMWRAMFLFALLALVVVSMLRGVPPGIPVTGEITDSPAAPESLPITVRITNPTVKTAIARVVESNETDSLDENKLAFSACFQGQHISVWAQGYYIKSLMCSGASPNEYTISLDPLNAADNSTYTWLDAEARYSSIFNCASCHSGSSPGLSEYLEWDMDGHSRIFVYPYFWTTYLGMDIYGSLSQQTVWSIAPDGRRFRLPPDPTKPYFGPGYKSDYPNENGNCVFCHVPAAVSAVQQGANLSTFMEGTWGYRSNVVTEGVTCDVCHKVTGVLLDNNKLPYVDHQGVQSISFVRPSPGLQFLSGPGAHLSTFNPSFNRTCAPIFSESEFCAPCHYGNFSGVEIYASYKEWLNSTYSNKESQNYRSCQDCHMSSAEPVGNTLPIERSACSEENKKFRDFSHNMMKYGTDPDNPDRKIPLMVKEAATVTIDQVSLGEGQVTFRVTVTNSGAGHKFPTDSPLRHLILLVEAKDMNNHPLTQISGPMIPIWGARDYAGYPGEIYAHILKDRDTNQMPSVAFWNPIELGSDTRLAPGQTVQKEYSFIAPSNGSAVVSARLIYRNVFINIADQKKWPIIDIEAANAPPVTVP